MKRHVFLSFDYDLDVVRVSQIREMGALEKETLFHGNDWEKVKYNDDKSIENWIDLNLQNRSCVIVLIGEKTSESKWVLYEIKKAFELKKAIFGIYIHNLKDFQGRTTPKGQNPFDKLRVGNKLLSEVVDCYDPSQFDAYNSIKGNIGEWIEYAIKKRE